MKTSNNNYMIIGLIIVIMSQTFAIGSLLYLRYRDAQEVLEFSKTLAQATDDILTNIVKTNPSIGIKPANSERICGRWIDLETERLVLSGNQLEVLPESVRKLQNLRELDLSHNKFSFLPEWLGELPNLTHLDVSYNQISDKTVGYLLSLPKITHLNISYNNIRSTGLEVLTRLPNLTHLKIAGNWLKLSSIQKLMRMKTLVELDMSNVFYFYFKKDIISIIQASTHNHTPTNLRKLIVGDCGFKPKDEEDVLAEARKLNPELEVAFL